MSETPPAARQSNRTSDLFLISVLGLFLELLLIRWISTEVRIFAYLENTVLVVCFLGLGMGCLTSRQPFVLRQALLPLAFLVALLSIPQTRFGLGKISEMLSAVGGLLIWGPGGTTSIGQGVLYGVIGLTLTFFLMALIWDIFVPIGRLLARLLDEHPQPIRAYSVNIAGSLFGVWLFVLLSALQQPPAVWFAVTALLFLWFAYGRDGGGALLRPAAADLGLLAGMVVFAWLAGAAPMVPGASWMAGDAPPAVEVHWSPYQKLVLRPAKAATGGADPSELGVWHIDVNNVSYQEIVDLDPARLPADPQRFPADQKGLSQYDIPALLHPRPERLLIVGAGSGNDAAGALRQKVGRVVAVDIDPVIIDLGRRWHPERPYDPQKPVEVVNDDARSFFATSGEKFDVISFGLLDAHASTSMTNARLDHYVYTKESLERARGLLAPGGVLVLSFYVQRDFISDRMARALEEVFGRKPKVFVVPENGYGRGGVFFVAGDLDGVEKQLQSQPRLKALIEQWQQERPVPLPGIAAVITDDWPYLYLETPSIPPLYLLLAVLLLLLLLRGLRRLQVPGLFRDWERSHWHFFFLGAAFLLLEVQNISKASVVLGNTWLVNAVIISGILALVLAANLIVSLFPRIPAVPVYVLLCGSCIGLYFIDLATFAFLPYATKALVVGGLTSLPMLFSGIVFIRSFAATQRKDTALGANLLGALVGALLQTVTFVTGIKALLLIVAGLYLAAYLTRPAAEPTSESLAVPG